MEKYKIEMIMSVLREELNAQSHNCMRIQQAYENTRNPIKKLEYRRLLDKFNGQLTEISYLYKTIGNELEKERG